MKLSGIVIKSFTSIYIYWMKIVLYHGSVLSSCLRSFGFGGTAYMLKFRMSGLYMVMWSWMCGGWEPSWAWWLSHIPCHAYILGLCPPVATLKGQSNILLSTSYFQHYIPASLICIGINDIWRYNLHIFAPLFFLDPRGSFYHLFTNTILSTWFTCFLPAWIIPMIFYK